jgi:hypothetical protein
MTRDPAAARAALQGPGVPDDIKAQFQNSSPP